MFLGVFLHVYMVVIPGGKDGLATPRASAMARWESHIVLLTSEDPKLCFHQAAPKAKVSLLTAHPAPELELPYSSTDS